MLYFSIWLLRSIAEKINNQHEEKHCVFKILLCMENFSFFRQTECVYFNQTYGENIMCMNRTCITMLYKDKR